MDDWPGAILGANSYGKDGIHVVKVERDGPRHRIRDLTVATRLAGDFAPSYTAGDNSTVLPTDTQKNTVHAFMSESFDAVETLGLRLATHFAAVASVREARIQIAEHSWHRIEVDGSPTGTAFAQAAQPTRMAWVTKGSDGARVEAGVDGIKVLKSEGSEFHGFLKDSYTTLAETRDRVLATDISARWIYKGADIHWSDAYEAVLDRLLTAFADTHSLAVQQTLFAMGRLVIAEVPQVREIAIQLPNLHHVPVDLAALGLPGRSGVFTVPAHPYGVITGTVLRDDAESHSEED